LYGLLRGGGFLTLRQLHSCIGCGFFRSELAGGGAPVATIRARLLI
jgi:hypothetical protein